MPELPKLRGPWTSRMKTIKSKVFEKAGELGRWGKREQEAATARKIESDRNTLWSILGTGACLFTGLGPACIPIGQAVGKIAKGVGTWKGKDIEDFKRQCMERSPVNTPTVIYHKDLYSLMNWTPYGGEAHKHNEIKEGGAGDYDIFCGFADNGVFIYPVNVCLGYHYRWHPKQCTWDVHKQKKTIDYDKIIRDYWKNKWTL